MNKKLTRKYVYPLLFFIGLTLIVGGIVTGKHGASVVGLIVAAVIVQQWMKWNRKVNDNKHQI
jgi:hypothetical protein